MRILISGSKGFLGNYIYSHLIEIGYKVDTIGKSSDDTILINLCQKFILEETYDCVIHVAGKAHISNNSVQADELFHKNNVVATSNLLNSIDKTKLPKYFVFISSVSVYGLTNGKLIDENSPLQASDSYGKSKVIAEDLIINWGKLNNVKYTILRLPLVVGENPPGNLGAMINGLKKGYYFNIGGVDARKSVVLASDVAKFVIPAALVGGIFNLTDGYHPTFKELSDAICIKLGRRKALKIPYWLAKTIAWFGDHMINSLPLNAKNLEKFNLTLTFDDSKARNYFNWQPTSAIFYFEKQDNKI